MPRRPGRDRHARLTHRASDAWDRLLTEHNVTLTTMLEALGEMLDDGADWVPERAIRRAQELDRQRYSRR